MKSLITLALSFMIVITQAHAVTGNELGLKNAIDELNYSLNVEWDQTDKNFYNEQMDQFQSKLALLKATGMTNDEMLDFVIQNVKDESLKADLLQVQAIAASEKLSADELKNLSQEVLKRNYNRGSSWIGAVVITGMALILVIATITVLILNDAQNNPDNCKYDYVCNADNTECSFENYHCY
jgi:hypothetical protein